jgi:hypothetical protein
MSSRPNVQSGKGREIPTLLLCAGDNLAGNCNLDPCTVYARSGVGRQGASNNKVADFLDVLRASLKTVSISYGDKSFAYDVDGLPAAQARFPELCRRLVR